MEACARTLDPGTLAGPERPGPGRLGARGERLAAEHLAADGLEVVARNWRLTAGGLRGELDLVALDHAHAQVVICEVKTRRDDAFGGPLAAVTHTKQVRLRRLAGAFLTAARLPYRRARFDVVGVWLPASGPGRLEHLRAAF